MAINSERDPQIERQIHVIYCVYPCISQGESIASIYVRLLHGKSDSLHLWNDGNDGTYAQLRPTGQASLILLSKKAPNLYTSIEAFPSTIHTFL